MKASKTGMAAKGSKGLIAEAVVLLRAKADGSTPLPAESRAMAETVLNAVSKTTGLLPEASTIFDSLHSFSVRAPKAFVDALCNAPQVAQVLPNKVKGSMLIEPVAKKSVNLPE